MGPNRQRGVFSVRHPVVFVTTYATATNDVEFLSRAPFLYLILDEATHIKNPDAERSRAAKALNAAQRLA